MSVQELNRKIYDYLFLLNKETPESAEMEHGYRISKGLTKIGEFSDKITLLLQNARRDGMSMEDLMVMYFNPRQVSFKKRPAPPDDISTRPAVRVRNEAPESVSAASAGFNSDLVADSESFPIESPPSSPVQQQQSPPSFSKQEEAPPYHPSEGGWFVENGKYLNVELRHLRALYSSMYRFEKGTFGKGVLIFSSKAIGKWVDRYYAEYCKGDDKELTAEKKNKIVKNIAKKWRDFLGVCKTEKRGSQIWKGDDAATVEG